MVLNRLANGEEMLLYLESDSIRVLNMLDGGIEVPKIELNSDHSKLMNIYYPSFESKQLQYEKICNCIF